MANLNMPFGARPIGHLDNTGYIQTNLYYVPSSDTSAYYINDMVISAAGADVNGVPQIAKLSTGTETPLGIVVGILPIYPGATLVGSNLNLERLSTPSTGKAHDYYLLVADSPDLVFEMQADSAATNLVAAKAGYNASITVAVPSPATHPISASVIGGATLVTTNTLNIKLMGLVRNPVNTFGAYAVYRCMFNLHERSNAGTTAI